MSKFYSKEKVIGSGSFGNVWLVKAKSSNNYFVLKELNLSNMNASETQHALTEVTVLSRCRHRNIIRYKDAVIDHKKGLLSLVMEYAEGGDLYTAIIKQDGVPFKEHRVITWFTQICLALQYIHHKSILHRDLKTRNIFLTRDRQVKVGDFGIARCLMETNELATTAIGTPYYLSPEICQRKPYKSDIWALGCILFEMASLSHPFQACNFPHLLTLIISGQRKELPGNCCLIIRELVDRLLKEDPDDRPTADEILALPSLQPYLSEVWVLQNTSSSLGKKFNEKIGLRSNSSNNGGKILAELEIKRRASISSSDSRMARNKFGFVSKIKNVAVQKSSYSSRTQSMKETKFSTFRSSVKSDPFSTYKISESSSLKRSKISMHGLCFMPQKKAEAKVRTDSKRSPENDESDRGYQSEEIMKNGVSGKFLEFPIGKTSTKKRLNAPDFEIEDAGLNDEVFDKNSDKQLIKPDDKPADVCHDTTECCHSQCQQCMLDMLWKNRIKGVIGPITESDQRTELIQKLQAIFGEDLFDDVYDTMISNWEASENNYSPKCIRDIARSLNYGQLQHVPLMMQLIQLDLVPK